MGELNKKDKEIAALKRELNDIKARKDLLADEMLQKSLEERAVTPGSSRTSTPRKAFTSEATDAEEEENESLGSTSSKVRPAKDLLAHLVSPIPSTPRHQGKRSFS